MNFEIIGSIDEIKVIAAGPGVRVQALLRKMYGRGRWRKVKGIATVRLPNGSVHLVGGCPLVRRK